MDGQVCRSGIVKRLTEDGVEVMVLQESACVGCHSKSHCTVSDVKERIVQANLPDEPVAVGDHVEVIMQSSRGHLAVVIAYILPAIFLVSGLLIFTGLGLGDGLSALFSLMVTAVYFMVIWFVRGKLNRKFIFSIRRMSCVYPGYPGNPSNS